LKNENSKTIAQVLDEHLIKVFGPPREISCDNAANLSGPEVKKLLAFYNVKLRRTVPYSPESHSLVENSNRYLIELIRLFSDQYKTTWPNVLSLATLIVNSVPRPQLKNHSPYYLIFQNEILKGKDFFTPLDETFLDIDAHVKRNLNNRNFAKLLTEHLLKIRNQRNMQVKRTYHSYPPGTMILVRDNRPRAQRKMFPLYFKCPEKVVSEYKCTIFSINFLGQVSKHSKNNIKLASLRSVKLFQELPDDIKLVLGEPFDADKFSEIVKDKRVPEYLHDIVLDVEEGPRLRSENLPDDTHLLETTEVLDETIDDVPLIGANDEFVQQLQALHDANELGNNDVTLENIPILYRSFVNNTIEDEIQPVDIQVEPAIVPINDITSDINTRNILPEGTRRKVRFHFPEFSRK
jgi:hypothetical protein